MDVYRLSKRKYAATLSGIGAAKDGARWNSKGVELIYSAANRSLAMAEVAVHFTYATLPPDYVMLTIYIPDDISIYQIQEKNLPTDWNKFPPSISTQAFGDNFVKDNKYCILKVPSTVTKGDFNLLINPKHDKFSEIKIINTEDFIFDNRLFK